MVLLHLAGGWLVALTTCWRLVLAGAAVGSWWGLVGWRCLVLGLCWRCWVWGRWWIRWRRRGVGPVRRWLMLMGRWCP